MSTAKILVVEDDESLGMVLTDALTQEGHRVTLERDGAKAAEAATGRRWDLILLDLMLPRVDGLEICRRVRAKGLATPVLMLTARGREEDRVQGLDLGADDYLVKPFGMKELLARVRARLRGGAPAPAGTLRFGAADVDLGAMTARQAGRETALTKTETELVRLFAKHPRVVLSRNRFLDEVWGYDRYPTTRTVDMHVARLREKIGDDGAAPRFIVTVHGVGYRYDPDGGSGDGGASGNVANA